MSRPVRSRSSSFARTPPTLAARKPSPGPSPTSVSSSRRLGRPADAIRPPPAGNRHPSGSCQPPSRERPVSQRSGLVLALSQPGAARRRRPALPPCDWSSRRLMLHEELVAAHHTDAEFRWRLARCLDEVGRIRSRTGRPADAAAPLDRAARFYESVARANPTLYRLDVVRNQLNIAFQRALTGRVQQALAGTRKAEDLLQRGQTGLARALLRPGLRL